MYDAQEGRCAICKKEEDCPRHKYLSIDHDHKTDKIRALLCNTCIKAIGLFEDSINLLENAIEYLLKFKP